MKVTIKVNKWIKVSRPWQINQRCLRKLKKKLNQRFKKKIKIIKCEDTIVNQIWLYSDNIALPGDSSIKVDLLN